ncbi:MAG: NADH-quinone oxidoreductase subunit J [Acidobacteriota bacterium]|nr:NADH-quinone oxidoreductase subunit J [Acidobacteriota bacterium]
MPALTGQLVVFGFASFVAIAFALLMVVQKTPVRSVLSLVVTFFGLSVLAILLAAPFIAALQIFVYAGAILVLFLFVIMLLNLKEEAADKDDRPVQRTLGLLVALGLGGLLAGATLRAPVPPRGSPVGGPIPMPDEIPALGRLLFSNYLLAFEVLSLLLLVAAVGALLLSKRRFE